MVSIVVWPLGALLRITGPFLLYFMYTELSTPFMQIWSAAKAIYGRKSRATGAASIAFAAAFLGIRATTVPVHAVAYAQGRPWDAAAHPGLTPFQRCVCAVTLPLPAVLNAVWSVQILAVVRKAVARKPPAP